MDENKINIHGPIKVLDGAFATDGGSISLLVSDTEGHRHNVLLTQHLLPPIGNPGDRKTGRLYFDGSLVGVRSDQEHSLVSLLKNANIELIALEGKCSDICKEQPGMIVGDDIKNYYARIAEGPEAALRHLVRELIGYVESAEYVTYAENHD